MDLKTNLQLISEAAAMDMEMNSQAEADINSVMEAYAAVPECVGITVTEAADVVVTPVGDDYFVEMTNLSPFLLDSGITSIAKALDMVAEANYLPAKSVGLIVESHSAVNKMLSAAQERARKLGNDRIRENAIAKVEKNNNIIKRLMSEGYKVVTKREDAKVCSKCGKAKCKCECGGDCGTSGGSAVIAEKGKEKAKKVCPECGKAKCECGKAK